MSPAPEGTFTVSQNVPSALTVSTDTLQLLSSRTRITHNLQGTMDFQKKKMHEKLAQESAATQLSGLFIRDDISISLQIIWHFLDWSCASYFNYKPTKKKVRGNNGIQNTRNIIWRSKKLKNKSNDRDYNDIKSGRYSYVVIKTKLYCHCRCIFVLKVRQFYIVATACSE